MTDIKTSELVAKRWSKALMELAIDDESISKENVLADLRSVAETIESSEELKNVINNPSISIEEKQIVICKLFENKIMTMVYNFLYVLNLRKRLQYINDIADEFEKKLEELKNIARVGVTSAIDISDEKREYIKSKISEKLKKDVIIDWNTDSDIIAGLVFNIEDTVVDSSIKHKLDELSKKIMR